MRKSTIFEGIGDRVRRLRKAAGQTQEEFADTLGVSLRSLKGYETGTRELPTSAILRLCDLSAVSPSWILLGRKDELQPEALDLLEEALVPGLRLLREHSQKASSEDWAKFLAVMMMMSYAQGTPINHADAKKILGLKDIL